MEPINWNIVGNDLYRCGNVTGKTLEYVAEKYRISTVIDLESDLIQIIDERRHCYELGISIVHIPIISNPLWINEHQVNAAVWYMKQASRNNPTIVHCKRGADRTGIVCALFKILYHKFTYDEAVEQMYRLGFSNFFWLWKRQLKKLAGV